MVILDAFQTFKDAKTQSFYFWLVASSKENIPVFYTHLLCHNIDLFYFTSLFKKMTTTVIFLWTLRNELR